MSTYRNLFMVSVCLTTLASCYYRSEVIATEKRIKKLEKETTTVTGVVNEFKTPGATYTGQLKDGQYEGFGTLKFTNGTVLKGHFANGVLIKGEVLFANGYYYTGGFKDNEFSGKGFLRNSKGDFYKGSLEGGLPNGEGLQYDNASQTYYKATFNNGQMEGEAFSKSKKTGKTEAHYFDKQGNNKIEEAIKTKAREKYEKMRDGEMERIKNDIAILKNKKQKQEDAMAQNNGFSQTDLTNLANACACSGSDPSYPYPQTMTLSSGQVIQLPPKYRVRAGSKIKSQFQNSKGFSYKYAKASNLFSYHIANDIPPPVTIFVVNFYLTDEDVLNAGISPAELSDVKEVSRESSSIRMQDTYEPLLVEEDLVKSICSGGKFNKQNQLKCLKLYINLIRGKQNQTLELRAILKENSAKWDELQNRSQYYERNRENLIKEQEVKELENLLKRKMEFEKSHDEFEKGCLRNPSACGCNTKPCIITKESPGSCACSI